MWSGHGALRDNEGAHTRLLDLEELRDDELERIKERYERLAEQARRAMQRGQRDTGTPAVEEGR